MFDNIGSKIKGLAQVVCWIGIIASVISGFAVMTSNDEAVLAGLLIMVLGAVGSLVGSFVLCGFGRLVENSDTLVEIAEHNMLRKPKEMQITNKTAEAENKTEFAENENSEDKSVHCPHCDRRIIVPEGTLTANCPWCNKKIKFTPY